MGYIFGVTTTLITRPGYRPMTGGTDLSSGAATWSTATPAGLACHCMVKAGPVCLRAMLKTRVDVEKSLLD